MIEGTDLAYYNTKVDYAGIHAVGIQFAFIKGGQGTTIVDRMRRIHRRRRAVNGVL